MTINTTFSTFLQGVSLDELYFRPADELSSFYWEYIDVYPELSLTGLHNIALLERGLLQLALQRYPSVLNLTRIYQNDPHNLFHDYRKLVRSIVTVPGYFQVFNSSSDCVNSALGILNKLYKKFGAINDDIVAYDYYVNHGEEGKAHHEEQIIDSDWGNLQSWMINSTMPFQFGCLIQNIAFNDSMIFRL